MSAPPTNDNHHDGAIRTLGDLLYADRQKRRVSEQEWVALVRSMAAGDQAALRALYERAHRVVFTLTMRITGNRQTAEELTLDVFHDAWRRASTYDPQNGPVLGWLMNQARSRAIDRLRYEQRSKRTARAGETAPEPGADRATQTSDERRMLMTGLATLTADERQAIHTAFFAELTYAETATRLGQPLGTVKTRIRSGLEKLRRAFASKTRMP
ncbi:MAG TPA: sigma-70 family RNA polymerase sigma factor [Steroidobacteraceae bacterium]|nr:sigma-70 family RNA polymerase sigma factor [Steroidobacteraceae bacterium]